MRRWVVLSRFLGSSISLLLPLRNKKYSNGNILSRFSTFLILMISPPIAKCSAALGADDDAKESPRFGSITQIVYNIGFETTKGK